MSTNNMFGYDTKSNMSGKQMEKNDNEGLKLVEKAGHGLLAVMLWCSSGGLMLLHLFSFLNGATSLFFTILGLFVPPVGLVNGLVYIVTGDSLQQYF